MRLQVSLFVSLSLFLTVGAATIFDDDFSSGSGQWVAMSTGANLETSATGGVLSVRNTTQSIGILKHDLSSTQTFTYSVTVRPQSSQFQSVGICFCLQDNLGGYFFTFDNKQVYSLYRVPPGGGETVTLAFLPSSHLWSTGNVLTVSKDGNRIDLFCNGRLLTTINDPTFPSGSIGLVVAGTGTTHFDDVRIVTGTHTATGPTCFTDDFASGEIRGWYISGFQGQVASSNGLLTLSVAAGANPQVVFTSGSYAGSSMRAVVSRQSQGTAGLYGLCLADVVQAPSMSYSYRVMSFLITGARNYAVVHPDSQTYRVNPPKTFINGTTDTLEVKFAQNKYRFFANGQLLDSLPAGPTFEGAGFWVGPDASASFDNFVVAVGSEPICQAVPAIAGTRRPLQPVSPRYRFVFDPLGRRMPAATGAATPLPNGIYIVHSSNTHGVTIQTRVW